MSLCASVLVLNPALVVLGGGAGSHLKLCTATAGILPAKDFRMPALRFSALSKQVQLLGAVAALEPYLFGTALAACSERVAYLSQVLFS